MKLRFRKIMRDELEIILKWRTMPEVTEHMFSDVPQDMEKHAAWFRHISTDPTRLDWIINAAEEDVGYVALQNISPVHKRCDWAYYLASLNVRGKGVGRAVELNILEYVFDTLRLNKLCGEIFLSNQKVVRIHEKYGSVVEGIRPQHIFKNGVFHNIVEIGILREKWEREIKGEFEFERAQIESLG